MPLYQPDQTILSGKYKIEKLLGAGAFGEVYLATHLDLGVHRAIKVAHRNMPGFGSTRFEEAFDRFRQEAQIGARLKHDNLIQIFDFYDGEESLHLVMEYAAGGSLEDKLQQKLAKGETFSVEETITILKDVASGLVLLHDQRNPIVHRDLKPSNILFDAEEHAKIADLGLAQVPGGLSQRSRLGSVAQSHPGTPAYMSPEQEKTEAMLRPTSDIYTLGVIAFEMLTGVNYNMQPPGTKLSELCVVPPPVSNLIDSMLAKDVDHRIWDGKKLFDQLNNLENVSAVKSEPVRSIFTKEKAAQLTSNVEKETGPEVKSNFAETPPVPANKVDLGTAQPDTPVQKPAGHFPLRKWGLIVFGLLAVGIFALFFLTTQNQKLYVPKTEETKPMVVAVSPAATETRQPTSEPTKQPTIAFTSTLAVTAVPTLGIGSSKISEKDGMEMVYVPEGEFTMGSAYITIFGPQNYCDTCPVHKVKLNSFWIDKFEVTNNQYSLCVGDGDCFVPEEVENYENPEYYNHPVVFVDWDDANKYCNWAGRRLPTEAEWEKSARGYDSRPYPWGTEKNNCSISQYLTCGGETVSVNSKEPGKSIFGVYNMGGNVAEWVFDWYDRDYYQLSSEWENPQGPEFGEYRITRGGDWNSQGSSLTTFHRLYEEFFSQRNDLGFRCAMDAEEQT
jgi:formylglycine-generating enzyme required for sulfatase activity/serine/threonine protein kinase